MITIQKIEHAQLGALCALEAKIFTAENFSLSRRNFLYHIKRGNVLLGAFEKDELTGYILLFSYQKSARIYSLGVDPFYRQQGIASHLIKQTIEIAKGMKKNYLSLEVRSDNFPAYSLYIAHGFIPIKTLPGYYSDGGDGIKMRLILMVNVD
jgi:ribosomal-protein-alanine N-acetyltransferase